ncbi:predicted protein [Nematostella vectensis]|uniref:Cytochrome c oxidase subunit 4 n=1 Tax=Nematostella vectensis TaxID=45351 RepID=A7RRF4_NEMVE|nr:cytochrome c oxidase subunit 4 isoform 2, mitochondrial [Nematostella vectensis]EDO45939.1 predicted protein [Nematostella vectensis]|eukprot:XP_001638002.1 predicted protein [Nematostella vectensis]
MANFLRISSRLVGRRIHTSAPRKFDPVPIARQEFGSDLEALKAKEKGPWTALSKEDRVALYQSQFPKTLQESKLGEPYAKKVVGGVGVLISLSLAFFAFLRTYIGPEPPPTLNEDWIRASEEKMRRQRTNPITGFTSKQQH